MKAQITIQRLIQTKLVETRAKNPAFSLRAFARKVGVSPAMVSRILSGNRGVSAQLAKRICDALMLDPEECSAILRQFKANDSQKSRRPPVRDEVESTYLKLTADHYRFISEWHYFAILSLFKTKSFRSKASWISKRLGISESTVEQALERLKRLELIAVTPDGDLNLTVGRYETPDEIMNHSLRKAHFESLELARKSLEVDPIELRDFSSMTLAFPKSRMHEAKRKIREFEREFDATFEESETGTDEVYRLAIQLFPLTKIEKSKKQEKAQ